MTLTHMYFARPLPSEIYGTRFFFSESFCIETDELTSAPRCYVFLFVGGEGIEPPVSKESGFTVHAATNYRLPSQYKHSLFHPTPISFQVRLLERPSDASHYTSFRKRKLHCALKQLTTYPTYLTPKI